MIQTTTFPSEPASETLSETPKKTAATAEPSQLTIANILNYSRNLELISSQYVKEIELIRS
jgi:hypothetical protein